MGLKFNMEEVEQKLLNMSRNAKNEFTDKALEEGEKPILKAMDKNVPVDTGELSDSLGEIKKTGSGTKCKVELGSTSKDRKVIERAYYQEHGNSSMMGKKWMKRSFQESKDEATNKISEYIANNIFK